MTVMIKPPADVAPPRVTDFPVVKGTIRAAKGHLGAFELTVDSYAQPAPSSRGTLTFATSRDGAVSKCDIVLDLSGGAPLFTGVRSARRLSARRSRRRRRRAQGGAQGARPRRHVRQAALCRLHRGSLRPFALEDRRLHALPRPLPDRRDRARRRSRRHRRPYLRGLRAMRRRLPDRRRLLRAAAGRHADAQAARAAHELSRSRRHAADRAAPRRRPRHAADRCAGALRRRIAGECAAARGQRGHAGRPRSHRRGFRLRRVGDAVPAAREAAPRRRGPGEDARAGGADPRGPGLRRGPRRHDRDRRSRCARDDAARDRRRRGRAASRELHGRRAASATSCVLRCASCSAPRPRRST